ncbi:MAG TPA: hypothetical protein VGB18_03515 [Candidatus Thermoplasmatota archaeon]
MKTTKITLIGERDLGKKAHRGIEASIALYRAEVDANLELAWVRTATITPESVEATLHDATGIWCTSGSPYENTDGALLAIQHARTKGIPFLGTCGGFQHALMEFAQNVLKGTSSHEELDPDAKDALIVQLECSLIGTNAKVVATNKERFASILGADDSIEEFNCNYGINTDLAGIFDGTDLEFVAHDEAIQVCAFRLRNHPFFIGTLFQPERRALIGLLHPIVRAFFQAT